MRRSRLCRLRHPASSRKPGYRKPEKALRSISAERNPNAGLVSLTMACLSYLVVVSYKEITASP
jgi:hypothetical protein